MVGQLWDLLSSQPFVNLEADSNYYKESISHAQTYFDVLIEAADIPRKIYITGFDAEQIWIQSRALLESTAHSPYIYNQTPGNDTKALTKRQTKGRRKLTVSEPNLPDDMAIFSETTQCFDTKEAKERNRHDVSKSSFILPGVTKSVNGVVDEAPSSTPSKAPLPHIDDLFFSIDAFKMETELFERADQAGRSLDGLDTNIDWHRNLDDQLDDSDTEDPQNNIMYTDFFSTPENIECSESEEAKHSEAKNENIIVRRSPPLHIQDLDSQPDIFKLMKELQEDMLTSTPGSVGSDSPDIVSEADAPDLALPKSTHTSLTDKIRELERQNVSQRDWTLSGETTSRQRPFNSLLQEDLDFERIGKPVPIITRDSTMTLEDMIKKRILGGDFDEIQRRNPVQAEKSRRDITELNDSQSKVGLAELYEQEMMEKSGSSTHATPVDVKSDALRTEIAGLFSTVIQQLDTLGSWHFTPKAPEPSLSIIQDIRSLQMEEVQINSNTFSMHDSTTLAPQEIYDPSAQTHQSDGVIKLSGIPMSHSEARRSRRNRGKGQKTNLTGKEVNQRAGDLLKSLQKGDITVIGKDGSTTALSGAQKSQDINASSSRLKL